MTPSTRPLVAGALPLAVGSLTACTGSTADPVPSASAPPEATGGSTARTADPAAAVEFEQALRERLRIPPLPTFALPTDLLASERDEQVRDQLGLEPGLYDGIAVLSARCDGSCEARSADSGTPLVGAAGAGSFKDATRTITVAGDGTGVYDGPGLHVAVLADGTGVYDDGTTRYSVRPGGEGTYTGPDQRLTVKPDGSGSYQDDDVRFWVGPDGSGGYDDGRCSHPCRASAASRHRGRAAAPSSGWMPASCWASTTPRSSPSRRTC